MGRNINSWQYFCRSTGQDTVSMHQGDACCKNGYNASWLICSASHVFECVLVQQSGSSTPVASRRVHKAVCMLAVQL